MMVMLRLRWIYVLLLALSLALTGCGETTEVGEDAGGEKDASDDDRNGGKDDGKEPIDGEDEDGNDDEDGGGDGGDDEDDDDGEDEDENGDPCAAVTCPDDENPCTLNRCNPANGDCETIPLSDVSCDDGLFCNGNDICINGVCTHSGDPCGLDDSCVEEAKTCGCAQHDDCPAGEWGGWSACDCSDPSNECSNRGTRKRTRTTYRCESAVCVEEAIEEDVEACECDTDGRECLTSAPIVVVGSCNWGKCLDGACQTHKCGVSQVCDNDRKLCVDCLSSEHCGGDTPVCDTASNQCVGCLSDSDCGGNTPVCEPESQRCVQCMSRAECCSDYEGQGLCLNVCCTAGTVHEFTCNWPGIGLGCDDECSSDAHCPADRPICHASQCVECTSSSDCQDPFLICQNNTCVVRPPIGG